MQREEAEEVRGPRAPSWRRSMVPRVRLEYPSSPRPAWLGVPRPAAAERNAADEAAAKARRDQEEAERERANEERLAAAAREAEEHEKAAREQEEAERREHEEQVEHVDEKFLEPPPPPEPEPEPVHEPEPEPVQEQHLPPVLPRSTTAPAKLTVATRLPQPPNILVMEYAKLGIGGLLACILLCGWRACRRCRSKRRQSAEISVTKRAPSPVVQARGTRARKLSKADDDDWDDLEGGWGPAPAPAPRAATPPARKAVRPARQPARQPARSARPQLGGGATPARSAAAAPPSRPATTATPPPRPSVTRAFFPRSFFLTVRWPDRIVRRDVAGATSPPSTQNDATTHRHRLARGLGRAARGAAAFCGESTGTKARAGAAGVLLRRGRRLGRERRPRRHPGRRLGRRVADGKDVRLAAAAVAVVVERRRVAGRGLRRRLLRFFRNGVQAEVS